MQGIGIRPNLARRPEAQEARDGSWLPDEMVVHQDANYFLLMLKVLSPEFRVS